jgi:riboflavin kinase
MSYIIPTLKALAKKGAFDQMITISTTELGVELGVSQQTASNRIRTLLEKGLVKRRLGTRDQSIMITRKGMGLLRKELADYKKIFGGEKHVTITGKVSTGLGEGQYYLNRTKYKRQLKQKLGYEPYEGTLNLSVNESEMVKLEMLPESKKIHIDGFKAEGRTFGAATCIPVKIADVNCTIVLPQRSHHVKVLEIISAQYLRDEFGLKDGDELTLSVEL